jgi:hypothetical protein
MQNRKIVYFVLLLGLFIAQFVTAYHTAEHIDHGISVISYNDQHDHEHENQGKSKHQCPECVLSKTLQIAFYHAPAYFSHQAHVEKIENQDTSVFVSSLKQKSNNPRAPPAFLI